jgi:hypothetical protein
MEDGWVGKFGFKGLKEATDPCRLSRNGVVKGCLGGHEVGL